MDAERFDALTRTLSTAGRRRALGGLLAMFLSFLALARPGNAHDAEAKKKKRRRKTARIEGPCGDGGGKANRCKRNRHCCTGYCDTRKGKKRRNGKRRKVEGRCRCRKEGQSCSEDRNCCPERTGRTCLDGVCQAQTCLPEGGACPGELPCCAGLLCDEGTCQPCDVCASGCRFSSISDAVEDASEQDTIRVCAGTYLEATVILIDRNLSLIGAGQGEDGTVVNRQGQGSVVRVAGEVTAVLEGLRLTGGDANVGGGIVNGGDSALTLTACTITKNAVRGVGSKGGGISNEGTLTLNSCTLSDNTADLGGGIHNNGTLTLNGSTVVENLGGSAGGGIVNNGILTLNDDSSVTLNTAFSHGAIGGGIYNRNSVTLNDDSSVTNNVIPGAGAGGGIFNRDTVTINDAGLICGNMVNNQPNNCAGFTSPACMETCPV